MFWKLLTGRSRAFEKRVKGKKGQREKGEEGLEGNVAEGRPTEGKGQSQEGAVRRKTEECGQGMERFQGREKKKRSAVCSALLGFQRTKMKEG